ncbi:HlyD family secretion protein [Granulicella sibirica]|uniref:Membrane fusion component of tripartite multidrug resistance system n=1 Tax=Granulicella sibirica TaxID=2479048 RepID=A0A4Q0T006_9BACT|nr:HlyD family secretion protein [Granulicella sibirica]RXH56022.1 Membrane fusion component of tripartite multidrug resistance system [Granulicella sibirica]
MADDQNQNKQGGGQTAQISGTVQIQPQDGDQGQKGKPNGGDDAPEPEKKNPLRTLIVVAVVLLLIAGAGFYYWRSTFSEDTDDAQVDGDLYQVSSRVTGQVVKVYVDDNQTVQAGQIIAEVDPTDYQVALNQAKANLASAEAAATQANVNVPITSVTSTTSINTSGSDVRSVQAQIAQSQSQATAAVARVVQAKANAEKAQLDVDRYTPLVAKDVISKQQFDTAVAQAAATKAAVAEAEATVIAQQEATRQAQQKLAQSRFQEIESQRNGPQQVKAQQAKANSAIADVLQAQARVKQAELNLSYTRITAPTAGVVNKKNVQVGANLGIGQDLLTIIPLTDLWVTANFKETQLGQMKVGQEVDIKVDALGGRHFTGKVTQVGGATGSRLSLFPPENATGNYVKVVQRIPVRIDFTNLQKENGDYALRPGFSVTPEVRVK